MSSPKQDINLTEIFTKSAVKPKGKSRKRPPPISIRFSNEERDRLDQDRKQLSISAYIRQKLFGNEVSARPKRYIKKQREPNIDHTEIARLLGTFGQSELARSIITLSMAAQAGDLDTSPEVFCKLEQACDDIHEIKIALIMALGVKPQGERK